ncbi:MAG TPA: MoxR family ATPase [Ktedonobacteraceae bacterium]|nr:MoxR family ATPase [Ktedonobacteraceae bacterium]
MLPDAAQNWRIYTGSGKPHEVTFPDPPPWREFTGEFIDVPTLDAEDDPYLKRVLARGEVFQVGEEEVDLINAALILRRPLLITGKPGSGKSSLAYSVARELKLGPVLRWPITSRSTLADGLYHYDAIGRLQEASMERERVKDSLVPDIGQYIQLGPLGAAFLPSQKPRVLLIDEIDKSDIDLPNDLLNIFEEGEFEIPELRRLAKDTRSVEIYFDKRNNFKVPIPEGLVRCHAFPFVILTSNGEREFPPAFLRRCIRLEIAPPDRARLLKIIEAHLGSYVSPVANELVEYFIEEGKKGYLAVDQLLNVVYLASRGVDIRTKKDLSDALLRHLSTTGISML